MKLVPYDQNRYLVSSGGDYYLVDLEENKGKGRCGCEDFCIRCQPKIDNKESGRRSCKHLSWLKEVMKTYNAL